MEKLQKNVIKTGIYKISNSINDKIYIGSSKNLKERKLTHFYMLRDNIHCNKILQHFVNKYGLDTLNFEVIEECNIENLISREQHYLDILNPQFNICKKADRPEPQKIYDLEFWQKVANLYNQGYRVFEISSIYPEITRSYLSKVIKGEYLQEINYLFNQKEPNIVGRKLKKEDIYKIAELYNNGKTCKEISDILYKSKQYQTITRIVRGETNKEYSHLFKYRKYKTLKGITISKETREKISKANTGKPRINNRGNIPEKIIKEIRGLKGTLSAPKIAEKFNIPFRTIRAILENRTYKYIN